MIDSHLHLASRLLQLQAASQLACLALHQPGCCRPICIWLRLEAAAQVLAARRRTPEVPTFEVLHATAGATAMKLQYLRRQTEEAMQQVGSHDHIQPPAHLTWQLVTLLCTSPPRADFGKALSLWPIMAHSLGRYCCFSPHTPPCVSCGE